MAAISASQSRATDSTNVLSTDLRSNVERLMTFSTSAVAVCCCSNLAQLVEQSRVLDGDDGLVGEVRDQLDLPLGERPHLLAVDSNYANQFTLFKHGHTEEGSCTTNVG